jgi:hypothetical protein
VALGADWCGLCFTAISGAAAPSTAATFTPVDVPPGGFRGGGAVLEHGGLYNDSRWRPGPMTFGPVGRVVATVCVLLPYVLFAFALPFGLVGMVAWTIGIAPRALRDIWAPSRRHYSPPDPT